MNRGNGNLLPCMPGISALDLEFSHDGQWAIVYVDYPGLTLWRARQDDEAPAANVFLLSGRAYPAGRRMGKQLAFFGSMPGKPLEGVPDSGRGRATRSNCSPSNGNEGDPSWSPDGASLAFGRLPWKTGNTEPAEIYVVDLKSHRRDNCAGIEWPPHCRAASPNGKYLLATKADSSAFLLFDLAKQTWTVVAHGAMGYPYWSQGTAAILYFGDLTVPASSQRGTHSHSRRQHKAHRRPALPVRQTADAWVGCGPNDLPITVREVGTEEIYALDWNAH